MSPAFEAATHTTVPTVNTAAFAPRSVQPNNRKTPAVPANVINAIADVGFRWSPAAIVISPTQFAALGKPAGYHTRMEGWEGRNLFTNADLRGLVKFQRRQRSDAGEVALSRKEAQLISGLIAAIETGVTARFAGKALFEKKAAMINAVVSAAMLDMDFATSVSVAGSAGHSSKAITISLPSRRWKASMSVMPRSADTQRARLVFMVEAMPVSSKGLTPGLPIDVMPLKAAAK